MSDNRDDEMPWLTLYLVHEFPANRETFIECLVFEVGRLGFNVGSVKKGDATLFTAQDYRAVSAEQYDYFFRMPDSGGVSFLCWTLRYNKEDAGTRPNESSDLRFLDFLITKAVIRAEMGGEELGEVFDDKGDRHE